MNLLQSNYLFIKKNVILEHTGKLIFITMIMLRQE